LLKFVHAADLHLDSPFVGLSEVDPEMRQLLREATFKAFNNVIDLCLNEGVDFLLLAGDVYDSKDRSLRAQLRLREGLKRLSDAGIRTYLSHGNHDPLEGWRTGLKWPDLVHTFGDSVDSIAHERAGEPITFIHGVSFKKADTRENLALKFERRDSPLFQVGLLHCNVGSNTGHEPYSPCSIADLEASRLDYWALGHVHKSSVLSDHGPRIAYAGNTQGRHINECGPRGCFLVNVDDRHDIHTQFIATDVLRWRRAELLIEGITDADGLLNGLQRCLIDVQNESDGRPAICRMSITGRGSMHTELTRTERLEEYLAEICDFGASLSPSVWIADMRPKTSPEIDIDRRMKSEDILGDCLRLIEQHRGDKAQLSELSECLNDLFAHREAGKHLDQLDDDALIDALNGAQSLLLDELLGDEA